MLHEAAQQAFVEYFRCPGSLGDLETADDLSAAEGYFTFGGATCFGRVQGIEPAAEPDRTPPEAKAQPAHGRGTPQLPFSLAEVVANLREERYRKPALTGRRRLLSTGVVEDLYYQIRPLLPVGIRKHLQRARLRGWQQIPFPRWPVDTSVDDLMRGVAGHLLRVSGERRLPFIWFWPDGAPSCTMLTHDVEGATGLAFCGELMDLDESFGLKAAYQLIPESSTDAWQLAPEIRRRGHEANLHDLNHDGRLYRDNATFLERARQINDYARRFGCQGFRSGAMYREQRWYEALDLAYDMSVPNVAHLEPQQGGCCTVMPYFVGNLLELPLTTVQDYSLFFALGDYSTRLWKEQIHLIQERNGLVSVIAHPDYLVGRRERTVYEELLSLLADKRDTGQTWVALPGEISRWWRDRQAMTLVPNGDAWRIDGPGRERARVGFAQLEGERVTYAVQPAA